MSANYGTDQHLDFDGQVDVSDLPDEPQADPVEGFNVPPVEERDEVSRLDPETVELVLESGTEFDLEPLKLRQFLRLLRIVSRGASDILDTANLDFDDEQAFAQTFLGLVLFSIPEAEDETVEFIQSVVRPRDLTGNPKIDLDKTRELLQELENPGLEDTITILTALIQNEADDLRSLGKRLSNMFKVAQKIGQAPK